jgi:hypothetical protein
MEVEFVKIPAVASSNVATEQIIYNIIISKWILNSLLEPYYFIVQKYVHHHTVRTGS